MRVAVDGVITVIQVGRWWWWLRLQWWWWLLLMLVVVGVLMLGVCAPLVVLFDAFLLITSACFLSGFVT